MPGSSLALKEEPTSGVRTSTARVREHRLRPSPLTVALEQASRCLLSLQRPDGHWCAELQGDTILESEYILLMTFLGREGEEKVRKAARYILTQARPDGAWSNYPGGPVDLSVSVKAYFALKLAGHSPQEPYMRRARDLILQAGGAERCNSFTKFYLAFLGQFPYESCATVPAELVFLPTWFYVNLYAMSSWTRTIVVPLSIFSAYKPVRRLPTEQGIAELFVEDPRKPRHPHPPTKRWFTATNFFLAVDRGIKWLERWGPQWVRRRAVEKAGAWMRDHFADSDGVGAIFPPIIYTIISLHCLGYADDSPEMRYALQQLYDLMIEEGDTLRLQPCFSPVWDTALAVNALSVAQKAGKLESERTKSSPMEVPLARAARWLLDREVRRPGDWSVINPELEPGGWFFEYRNGFYPDTDDTAMVLMGLARSGHAWQHKAAARELHVHWREGNHAVHPHSSTPLIPALLGDKHGFRDGREANFPAAHDVSAAPGTSHRTPIRAAERGVRWLLGMQNKDGGWAAFDRDINRELLTKVPFADHNAMLDPSCPDITARVLEALGQYGMKAEHPQARRAIRFIEKTQDRRGCWIGRWGVNYLYGTWQVLAGLDAIGYDMGGPVIRRAVAWLRKVQQPCGGWGESCHSYEDPRTAGQGPVTASQTGWALLGLLHAGEARSEAVRRGIDYLVATQDADGAWREDAFTGTGFPRVFYLKYHYYRLYFPLMALARYRLAISEDPAPSAPATFELPSLTLARA